MTEYFYSNIVFWFTLAMSTFCVLLFATIAIMETRARHKEAQKAGRHLESMAQVGELAEKFAKSGFGPTAMACAVLFCLLGTGIALAIDKLTILSILR